MSGGRRARILAKLEVPQGSGRATARLCEVSAEVTSVSGAAIMLVQGDAVGGSLCTTDEVSALIEELQYVLGEGPCIDAILEDRPVTESDLVDPTVPRWSAFTPTAVGAGARAVFGFPLHSGAIRLGALSLYRNRPGPLTDDQHAAALVMADVVAESVIAMQRSAPPGAIAPELEDNANFRYIVHQAAGMVSVQLGVTVDEALVRLRAHAFANNRPLTSVAKDVVDRSLRFHDRDDGKEAGS